MAKFKIGVVRGTDNWPCVDRETKEVVASFECRRLAREFARSVQFGQGLLPGVWDRSSGVVGEMAPRNEMLGPETT